MYTAYKKRDKLMGFSITKFIMGLAGGSAMLVWSIATGNWGVVAINIFHLFDAGLLLYLVARCEKRRKRK